MPQNSCRGTERRRARLRADGEPTAYRAFRQPHRREQRRDRGKNVRPRARASTDLGDAATIATANTASARPVRRRATMHERAREVSRAAATSRAGAPSRRTPAARAATRSARVLDGRRSHESVEQNGFAAARRSTVRTSSRFSNIARPSYPPVARNTERRTPSVPGQSPPVIRLSSMRARIPDRVPRQRIEIVLRAHDVVSSSASATRLQRVARRSARRRRR